MLKSLITTTLLLAGAAHAAGWSGPLTVDRSFTENSDLIVIYTLEGGIYTPGCQTNAWIFVASTDSRRARAWAAILSAQATGQKIQLWYTDQCAIWSYHEAASIMLHRP
jgi:hypothetical protein